jgi:hypothetical protein
VWLVSAALLLTSVVTAWWPLRQGLARLDRVEWAS